MIGASAQSANERERQVRALGKSMSAIAIARLAIAPSGRSSVAPHASNASSIAARFDRAAGDSASAHSLARLTLRARIHANGTTSIPLAANHVNAGNAMTIAAAPIAAVPPASFWTIDRASYASAASAANESAHAGQRIASPRNPTSQNGARSTGQRRLVAPLDVGSPAWKRNGCPSANARAYWKWMYESSRDAPGWPTFE